jgi:hypothetical protein
MAGISNHFDTLTAIKAVIDGLALTGLTGGTVIQEVANYLDQAQTLPFISISPFGPEKMGDELNDRDGCYYGVLIAIIAKRSPTDLEQRLSWRQSVRRKMNNNAIAGLGQNYNLMVEPQNAVELRAFFDRKMFVSSIMVRAYFQEPRT